MAGTQRICKPSPPPHLPFDGKNRRLRIGYVGAFFRDHCQSLFTHSLLANHDRSSFELFCYADGRTVDAVTARLQEYVDHWRDITRLSDVTVATLIARDRLDILIDLTMHMGGGRPLAMARKPAPVQAAWLAYPGTTGIFRDRLPPDRPAPRIGQLVAIFRRAAIRSAKHILVLRPTCRAHARR